MFKIEEEILLIPCHFDKFPRIIDFYTVHISKVSADLKHRGKTSFTWLHFLGGVY